MEMSTKCLAVLSKLCQHLAWTILNQVTMAFEICDKRQGSCCSPISAATLPRRQEAQFIASAECACSVISTESLLIHSYVIELNSPTVPCCQLVLQHGGQDTDCVEWCHVQRAYTEAHWSHVWCGQKNSVIVNEVCQAIVKVYTTEEVSNFQQAIISKK